MDIYNFIIDMFIALDIDVDINTTETTDTIIIKNGDNEISVDVYCSPITRKFSLITHNGDIHTAYNIT